MLGRFYSKFVKAYFRHVLCSVIINSFVVCSFMFKGKLWTSCVVFVSALLYSCLSVPL